MAIMGTSMTTNLFSWTLLFTGGRNDFKIRILGERNFLRRVIQNHEYFHNTQSGKSRQLLLAGKS